MTFATFYRRELMDKSCAALLKYDGKGDAECAFNSEVGGSAELCRLAVSEL